MELFSNAALVTGLCTVVTGIISFLIQKKISSKNYTLEERKILSEDSEKLRRELREEKDKYKEYNERLLVKVMELERNMIKLEQENMILKVQNKVLEDKVKRLEFK